MPDLSRFILMPREATEDIYKAMGRCEISGTSFALTYLAIISARPSECDALLTAMGEGMDLLKEARGYLPTVTAENGLLQRIDDALSRLSSIESKSG